MNLESVRRTQFIIDSVAGDGSHRAERPTDRVAVLAAVRNLSAGQAGAPLRALEALGATLSEALSPRAAELLGRPADAYGKGAIVGVDGELEHAAALLHPRLGRPMRAAIGGGEAIIGSAVKVGPAGTTLDIPINHRHDIWSFDHLDTMTVFMDDAPRPGEILLAIVFSAGGRICARTRPASA